MSWSERIKGPMGQAQMSGTERVNTALSGSGRVDDIKGHPQGEIRGQTKLVKITEDVRKFAAEQKLSEDDALRAGMEQKSREFSESGSEIYSKA
jgi:hypothetical protein